MKCRQAQSRLAVYSAEHLSDKELIALCEHLDKCPDCHREWVVMQSTLITLSTASQPLLSREVSEKMWLCCEERLRQRTQQGAYGKAVSGQSPLVKGGGGYDSDTAPPAAWNWFLQPQLGWAALGAAVAIFGSVWILTPAEREEQPLTFTVAPGAVAQVAFEHPPDETRPLVNHHAAMSIDPFTDHVGTSLVSYSATASGR